MLQVTVGRLCCWPVKSPGCSPPPSARPGFAVTSFSQLVVLARSAGCRTYQPNHGHWHISFFSHERDFLSYGGPPYSGVHILPLTPRYISHFPPLLSCSLSSNPIPPLYTSCYQLGVLLILLSVVIILLLFAISFVFPLVIFLLWLTIRALSALCSLPTTWYVCLPPFVSFSSLFHLCWKSMLIIPDCDSWNSVSYAVDP